MTSAGAWPKPQRRMTTRANAHTKRTELCMRRLRAVGGTLPSLRVGKRLGRLQIRLRSRAARPCRPRSAQTSRPRAIAINNHPSLLALCPTAQHRPFAGQRGWTCARSSPALRDNQAIEAQLSERGLRTWRVRECSDGADHCRLCRA